MCSVLLRIPTIWLKQGNGISCSVVWLCLRSESSFVSSVKVRLQQHVCSIQYGVSVHVRAAADAHAIAVSHVFGAWSACVQCSVAYTHTTGKTCRGVGHAVWCLSWEMLLTLSVGGVWLCLRSESSFVSSVKVRLQQHVCSIGVYTTVRCVMFCGVWYARSGLTA